MAVFLILRCCIGILWTVFDEICASQDSSMQVHNQSVFTNSRTNATCGSSLTSTRLPASVCLSKSSQPSLNTSTYFLIVDYSNALTLHASYNLLCCCAAFLPQATCIFTKEICSLHVNSVLGYFPFSATDFFCHCPIAASTYPLCLWIGKNVLCELLQWEHCYYKGTNFNTYCSVIIAWPLYTSDMNVIGKWIYIWCI